MPQYSLKHVIVAVVIFAAVAAVATFALQGNRICQAIAVGVCFIVPILIVHAVTYVGAYVATNIPGWPKSGGGDPDLARQRNDQSMG
jgi:uncharacterized membrane protein